jgi:hypothetical protein
MVVYNFEQLMIMTRYVGQITSCSTARAVEYYEIKSDETRELVQSVIESFK